MSHSVTIIPSQSRMFADVMRLLWDGGPHDFSSVVAPMASRARSLCRNPENAFDVLGLLWPSSVMTVRAGRDADGYHDALVTVTFPDGSLATIGAVKMIGSAVLSVR